MSEIDPQTPPSASRTLGRTVDRHVPFAAFAAFGVFWGAWGAALPALRSSAGATDAQLGTALLFVGVGALPAMLLSGRLLDRCGSRVVAPLLASLAAAGAVAALVARDWPSLVIGMLLVGATSGAADVAINAVSAQVEHETGRPVLTRAHGMFSSAVVVASLAGGQLLSSGGGSVSDASAAGALVLTFAAAGGLVTALSVVVWRGTPHLTERRLTQSASPPSARHPHPRGRRIGASAALVLVGAVGALAYATENAHQSWGAVFLSDTFAAPASSAALAPAVFAATAAVTRLTLAPLSLSHPTTMTVAGGAVAATGSVVVATAGSAAFALIGLAVAAAGTATLFPTLLGRALRGVPNSERGRATSTVSTTAYLGFLLGPAYVGLLAEASGLRGAMVGIAALAAVFTVAALSLGRRGHPSVSPDRG